MFKKYLSNLIKKKFKRTHSVSDRSFLIPGNEIYTLQNKIAVDFIGKFENIENDLNTIKQKLNFLRQILNCLIQKIRRIHHFKIL